ncbi:MAG: hypothetical protein E7548_06005 [Ruminococcaceae bacterium]|nr:hypothetical protein [Oscillospiraceae bacterium]
MKIMKKFSAALIFVLLFLICGCGGHNGNSLSTSEASKKYVPINFDNMKAIWLSQFDLKPIYLEGGKQRPKSDFEAKITTVLKNVKDLGFNTIFVQVRPYADSFYPSTLYPASSYVTGDYGVNFSYDPFGIIVAKAHSLNLSVHAWINPMRAVGEEEIKKVPNVYKIKQWYNEKSDRLVNVEGRLYLNPAYSEVRKLIIDGANEILRLYKIDGLHMDDYFYPTVSSDFDKITYENYLKNGGKLSLADFRRENLNLLVKGLFSAVKGQNDRLLFGISPAGNLQTVFNEHYADVYSWCSKAGYIDYICPQVYFGLKHEFNPFSKVINQWQNIIKNEKVRLIIGMTLGKAKAKDDPYAGSGRNEWKESSDILKRCLQETEKLNNCAGVSFFSYQYFYLPLENTPDPDTKAETDNLIPLLKEIKWK